MGSVSLRSKVVYFVSVKSPVLGNRHQRDQRDFNQLLTGADAESHGQALELIPKDLMIS